MTSPYHLDAPKHHGGKRCFGTGDTLIRVAKVGDLIMFKCPVCGHLFYVPEEEVE